MTDAFKIGIAGLGTVGTGVIKILTQNADIIAARAGRPIEIKAVSARSNNKDRGVDLSGFDWVDDAGDLAGRDDLDCVVELIGGSEGLAADLVRESLKGKKHVVTANKALVAHHGFELAKLAEGNGVSLNYEAAVAGGIPAIKAMREGLAANKFTAVYGILNGTCNYILTEMRETGRDFGDVLKDAQAAGYAEADPTFDVEGIDAAHKLCILSSIAFGVKPDFDALTVNGISHIDATDIAFATELGYRIKLLGVAQEIDGKILQVVEPCVVPIGSPLGSIEDVYNGVYIEGNFVETPLLTGRGAGEGPTASSVVADIIDLARGISLPTFGIPAEQLKELKPLDAGECDGSYYLRLNVLDKSGVLAEVSAILRDHNISVESMMQRGRDPEQPVPIVLTTHETRHADMIRAVEIIGALDFCVEKPCLMVIRDL
ncbi:MAG: homoserine dehydrogenase [Alphaproteobacteria bacterium]|nr:homoserine dehydrogenase [Alphaproteobacteria bacterium]